MDNASRWPGREIELEDSPGALAERFERLEIEMGRPARFVPENKNGVLVEVTCRVIGARALLVQSPEILAKGPTGRAIEIGSVQRTPSSPRGEVRQRETRPENYFVGVWRDKGQRRPKGKTILSKRELCICLPKPVPFCDIKNGFICYRPAKAISKIGIERPHKILTGMKPVIKRPNVNICAAS